MQGYDEKPETCRLFPFNRFARVGSFVVVTPHLGLCPLELAPAGRPSAQSSHEQLLAELAQRGIRMPVPIARHPEGRLESSVALERLIVALSHDEQAREDYATHLARQAVLTLNADVGDGGALSVRGTGDVGRLRERIAAVLGYSVREVTIESPMVSAVLAAATPTVRAQLLFPAAAEVGNIGPASAHTALRSMVALSCLTALAEKSGMPTITYQTVLRLFSDNQSLILLLAHADSAVTWRRHIPLPATEVGIPEYESQYVALLCALSRGAETFGVTLEPHLPEDLIARNTFLRRVARHIGPHLQPSVTHPLPTLRRRVAWSAMRWALSRLEPAVASRLLASRAGRTKHRDPADRSGYPPM